MHPLKQITLHTSVKLFWLFVRNMDSKEVWKMSDASCYLARNIWLNYEDRRPQPENAYGESERLGLHVTARVQSSQNVLSI